MRKLFYAAFAIIAVAVVTASCADDTIGSSINDTRSGIIEDSSFTITGVTVANGSVRSRSSYQLIGRVTAVGYGTLKSDAVMQFMPSTTIETDGINAANIDSCHLNLTITAGNFTGDSLAPMRMTAYRLTKQLPYPIYSDFNPDGYYDPAKPVGSVAYSATAIQQKTTTDVTRSVVMPLDVNLARELFNAYQANKANFETPEAFAQIFPGLYITNTYGEGHVMNFYETSIKVYYHKTLESGKDTTLNQTYAIVTPEVVYNNNISLDIDESILKRVDDGQAIVMSPAGLEVKLHFPAQEIIDLYNSRSADGISIINSLELEIPVEEITNEWNIAPPAYLLMTKDGYKETFFEKDSLTNNKDSFYASYNAFKKSYTFTGMRDYIINIIKNQNGIASSADINLTVTPIDVTSYTTTASYYTSASTIITKISPAVSKPAIARLRLDKAKARIVYSKQSLY